MKPAYPLTAVLLLVVLSSPTLAHDQGASYSRWTMGETGASVWFRTTRRVLGKQSTLAGRSPGPNGAVAAYVQTHLRMRVGERPCRPVGPVRRRPSRRTHVVFTWSLSCPGDGPRTIETRLFQRGAPNHLHFATVIHRNGTTRRRLLSSARPRWSLPTRPGSPGRRQELFSLAGRYLNIGVHHVLGGWDHLAFVLGLVLIAGTGWQLVGDVTGFTLGHSLTLGLAAMGILDPSVPLIESLIALSIVFVGVENLWWSGNRSRWVPGLALGGLGLMAIPAWMGFSSLPLSLVLGSLVFFGCYLGLLHYQDRPRTLRFWLAGCFGLVHGFGFAGRLTEHALTPGTRVAALLGFNVGVELGQLAFVGGLVAVYALVRKTTLPVRHRWVVQGGSTLVVATGLYWFVRRAFGA